LARETGIGVDARGGPVIDPTENVIALTDAANKRQDDLRQLNNERINAEIRVLQAQFAGLKDVINVTADHLKEIRRLETERVNAVRQVDVAAGNTAADRAQVAIQTLAASQAAAAETLRAMVTTTASTIATQTAENFSALGNRIAQLEKSSYEGAGKGTGAKNTVTYVVLAVGLVMSLITIGSVVVAIAFAIRR
jgi:hypothetical protein